MCVCVGGMLGYWIIVDMWKDGPSQKSYFVKSYSLTQRMDLYMLILRQILRMLPYLQKTLPPAFENLKFRMRMVQFIVPF